MTREMKWMGFLGTLLILVALGINLARESNRQARAVEDLRIEAVIAGIDLYAENCTICHGAEGEGLGATPALNSDGLREMDFEDVFHVIERGRYNTNMAAYGVDEGGIFTNAQIDSLVAVIQYANWDTVAARVDELGLTPPEMVVVELSDETLGVVRGLPNGDTLAGGLTVYVEECAACHGANGEGTALAPALNSAELLARMDDADLVRTIGQGVPGTLMAGWDSALADEDIVNVVYLVQHWTDLDAAGVEMPVIEVQQVDMSPEAIAQGERLFDIACAQCHGPDGYGTPLAPALNNQTFLGETPDAAIQQIIALGVSGTSMPAWGGRLSEADIAALTAYLRSLEPTAPAIVDPANTGAGNTPGGGRGGPPWRQN
jgi:mono/diheme cytochrome c family protein